MFLGGIEAGGTKMVLSVCDEKGNVIKRTTVPTGKWEETISQMVGFYKENKVDSLGIASFGPIDLNKNSETYGNILRTPKKGWENVNIVKPFEILNIPIGLDTDVNGAILGEVTFGCAKNCESAIYITIGTGIGVGVYINGELLHGALHPESGHMLLTKHPDDVFSGVCPYHDNCFEGLASGPSIEKRWGKKAYELHHNNEVWEMESWYIAQAIANYILCYSPQKIVLWGGVMHTPDLIDLIKEKVSQFIRNYVDIKNIDSLIVTPSLGNDVGIIGASQLGYRVVINERGQ